MNSVILHLDMNSYFASVIQQDNVQFRGKVLGVCEHLGGIIISASKEAKVWGIKTGTPVWEARKLYPKIILTHTTPERFRFYTRKLIKLVSDYTSKVEVYSIDEVFLDITRVCNIRNSKFQVLNSKQIPNLKFQNLKSSANYNSLFVNSINPFEEAVRIAVDIKHRMKKEVGDWLTCSVGIAENKILAKIGSDFKKPNGIVVTVENQNAKIKMQKLGVLCFTRNELYYHLKLTDVPGIGHRQEKNLNVLGIKTLLDLKNFPKSHLVARFGSLQGHHLYNLGQLNSTWKASVEQDREIKSIGHMYTLPKEYRKAEFFQPVLYKLCEMVGRRLRKKNLEGNVLSFFIYSKDYDNMGESKKIGDYICDGREIFMHAIEIFKSFKVKNLEFKLIGITVSNLRSSSRQLSLFGQREKALSLIKALDKVNDKYGEFTIIPAPIITAGKVFRDSVGFGRVKELW